MAYYKKKQKGSVIRPILVTVACLALIAGIMYATLAAAFGDMNPENWRTAQTQPAAPDNEETPDPAVDEPEEKPNGEENNGDEGNSDGEDEGNENDTETPDPDNTDDGEESSEGETGDEEDEPAPASMSLHVHALSENDGDISPLAVGGIGDGVATMCPGCFQLTATQTKKGTATCTKGVMTTTACSSCGYFDTTTGDPLGHRDFTWIVTEAPTPDSTGTASYKCGHCTYVEKTATVYALPEDPVKEGYHFVGWYYDEAFEEPYNGELIFEDTALYARMDINECIVIFDSDGGTEIDEITTDWNTTISTTIPEKTGYNFLGWYTEDGTKFEDTQVIKSNTTLKARWQIKTFTVNFYVEGELYTSVTVDYGSLLSDVADAAAVYAVNILSFENVNSETPTASASELRITDDMTVTINNPTMWQKITNSKYTPYVIGGVCAFALVCVVVGIVAAKKKKG